MPKFRLRKDVQAHSLFQPSSGSDAYIVEPGDCATVPGTLVTARPKPIAPNPDDKEAVAEAARVASLAPLPEDAYIVENNGEEKAWPKSTWELVEDKAATKAAAPVKEN